MDGQEKRTDFVAPMTTQYNTCQLLPIGNSEGHSLLENSQHAGQILAFDTQPVATTIQHIPRIFQNSRNSWHHMARLCITTNR
jgi:hypothetical protein